MNIFNKKAKIISKEDFDQMLTDLKTPLVFGKSGIGKASMISECFQDIIFFDEINQAPTEMLGILYRERHTHARKRIPYKYGKHAYRKEGR